MKSEKTYKSSNPLHSHINFEIQFLKFQNIVERNPDLDFLTNIYLDLEEKRLFERKSKFKEKMVHIALVSIIAGSIFGNQIIYSFSNNIKIKSPDSCEAIRDSRIKTLYLKNIVTSKDNDLLSNCIKIQ